MERAIRFQALEVRFDVALEADARALRGALRFLPSGFDERGRVGQRTYPPRSRGLVAIEIENTIGIVALLWLIASLAVMTRSIRRGRDLAEALAARHPAMYEAMGRPRPGYFESARRTRFAQFVGHREFENLEDGALVAEFERYRKSEARLVVSILASGASVALVWMVARRTA